MKEKKIKPWRLNYIVSYVDKNYAREYRDLILPILINVAQLRGIECAIMREYRFCDDASSGKNPTAKEPITDLVYFRSSPQTQASRKEFRNLLDHIFEGYGFGPVEAGAQLIKALPQYPFPDCPPQKPRSEARLLALTQSELPS